MQRYIFYIMRRVGWDLDTIEIGKRERLGGGGEERLYSNFRQFHLEEHSTSLCLVHMMLDPHSSAGSLLFFAKPLLVWKLLQQLGNTGRDPNLKSKAVGRNEILFHIKALSLTLEGGHRLPPYFSATHSPLPGYHCSLQPFLKAQKNLRNHHPTSRTQIQRVQYVIRSIIEIRKNVILKN